MRVHMGDSSNSHKTIPELNHQFHAFRQISTRIFRSRRLKINEKLFDAILFSIYLTSVCVKSGFSFETAVYCNLTFFVCVLNVCVYVRVSVRVCQCFWISLWKFVGWRDRERGRGTGTGRERERERRAWNCMWPKCVYISLNPKRISLKHKILPNKIHLSIENISTEKENQIIIRNRIPTMQKMGSRFVSVPPSLESKISNATARVEKK